ncbi:MAG: GGDEF domain-containing protein [Treponema sp.]|nr:GGDEF domain-containing protein [Treponema sp.]
MYYSSIGIIASLILLINNYDIIINPSKTNLSASYKAYRNFLITVLLYYITDIIWEPLYSLKLTKAVFIETTIYFIVMAFSVYLWTKYVSIYLNRQNKFSTFLKYTGIFFLFLQITVLIVNFFIPIAFWFDEEGIYHTGFARNLNLIFQILMFTTVNTYMFFITKKTEGNIKRRHGAIGLFCLSMIILVTLQMLYPLLPYYAIGYMLGTCLLHTFVVEDEKEAQRTELEAIIQAKKLQEEELGTTRKMAYSDPMTGVKNKMAYLEDSIGIELKMQEKVLENFGLAFFDLNDLKKINDNYGHDTGDKYIRDASSIICTTFKHSPVYRIGGDEFIAFISGDDFTNHKELLTDFNIQIEQNLSMGKAVISCGFTEYMPETDSTFNQMFERADHEMYERKKQLKAMQNSLKISL